MKARDFCYWLQGYFELSESENDILTISQVKMIQRHLNMVFKHEIDPSFGLDKLDLSKTHSGTIDLKDTPIMC